MIRYMGPDHPTITYRVDPWRVADPSTGAITDRRLRKVRGRLRWVVAVVTCPHCGGEHEHPVAALSGWGFFRASCAPLASTVGYYLAPPVVGEVAA